MKGVPKAIEELADALGVDDSFASKFDKVPMHPHPEPQVEPGMKPPLTASSGLAERLAAALDDARTEDT